MVLSIIDLGVHITSSNLLYSNNKIVFQVEHNDIFHETINHIEIDCHFIQHHYKKKGNWSLWHTIQGTCYQFFYQDLC